MAKLWIVYNEGLRLFGAVAAEVPLESSIARVDIAPWRFFTAQRPEARPLDEVLATSARKRALLEIESQDRYDLCGLTIGFFESPYSPAECMHRLGVAAADNVDFAAKL
jgi:hypothetical protein